MSIEFDAVAVGGGPDDLNFTHTVTTSGSGRILIVGVGVRSDDAQGTNDVGSVTYGGDGLTEKAYYFYSPWLGCWFWALPNPKTGANSVVVDISPRYAGCGVSCVSVSYTGVDGSEPFGDFYQTQTYTPAALTQAVASAEGELVVSICNSLYTTLHTPDSGATERGETGYGTGGAHNRTSINDEPGAASVTVGFSGPTNQRKILHSVSLRPEVLGRQRAVKYFHNVWDPTQAVLDNTGRDVPVEQIKGDDWLRTLGVLLPTSKVYTNLIGNPEVGYIEAIKKSERDKTARIKAGRESLLATFLSRLAGRGV